ncbi:MAG: ssb [Microbacterium sp.]|jgi:hypothetical protein|nr:ssb [Microbacterium sp.]
MARRRNAIWYEGRMVNREPKPGKQRQTKLSRSKAGKFVLDLLVAEGFQEKNSNAPERFKDATKAADDYVNTYTAWHKVRIFADADDADFLALVSDPQFNHGCVIEIDASYREEAPWTDNNGMQHAGRQETIFWGKEDGGTVSIKVLPDGRVLGARDEHAVPLYNGNFDALPQLGGSGGGGPAAPEYDENEGF